MTNAEARFNKTLRPRKPEGSLGRTALEVHLNSHTALNYECSSFLSFMFIVQELCESRGGRPGLSVLTSLLVSVDVKIY